jgi:hypothetical protein
MKIVLKNASKKIKRQASRMLHGSLVIALIVAFGCAELVPRPLPNVVLTSPRNLSILHESSLEVSYLLDNDLPRGMAVALIVNGSDTSLRTRKRSPNIQLSGLAPGICELEVAIVDESGSWTGINDSALIYISSAALSAPSKAKYPAKDGGRGAGAQREHDGRTWPAVALCSDDWGRTADMIPVFPDQAALDRAVSEGWDPGAWGRATVETAADVRRLFDLLDGLNSAGAGGAGGIPPPSHQRVAASPFWVVGGPAYDRMAARWGCPGSPRCRYEERRIDGPDGGPAAHWPHLRGDLRALYR